MPSTVASHAPHRAGDALLHPVAIAAIALLLLNDHILKAAYPGFVTGKLSDIAGLTFFPLFLVSIHELIVERFGRPFSPSASRLFAAVVITALVFSLTQIWPPATQVYRFGLGALQWPIFAVGTLMSGGELGPIVPVDMMPDPSDLMTVPAVMIAFTVGWRRTANVRVTEAERPAPPASCTSSS